MSSKRPLAATGNGGDGRRPTPLALRQRREDEPRDAQRDRRERAFGFVPSTAIHRASHSRTVSETPVDAEYMRRLKLLYFRNPALQAARRMIHSQVLSNGLRLVRDGKPVKTTPHFQRHLDTHYLRFAHQCVDSIILYGFGRNFV